MTISDNAARMRALNDWALKIASSGDVCPPVAYDQSVYCDENGSVSITLEGLTRRQSAVDARSGLPTEGDDSRWSPITSTPFTLPGNTVVYEADSGYIGPDDFMFEVSDGELVSPEAMVSMQVGFIPNPDECDGAAFIANGQWEFDTTSANTDGQAHSECQFDGQTYHDVWYRYEACGDGQSWSAPARTSAAAPTSIPTSWSTKDWIAAI